MKALLYWTVAILLLAGVTHLGYVLAVPHFEMRTTIDDLRQVADEGALTVLSREDSMRLMGPDGAWLVHALCIYDLSRGPLAIDAKVPHTYWSMAIYAADGETFYSLNDRQAGIDRVNLLVRRSSDRRPEDEQDVMQLDGDVFTVRAPQSRGLVVLRALAGGPAEYEQTSRVLAQSRCGTAAG